MTLPLFASLVLSLLAATDKPGALFAEAEQLSRSNRKVEAMAKVEAAIAEIERAHAAGEDISWQGMNGFRFAAQSGPRGFSRLPEVTPILRQVVRTCRDRLLAQCRRGWNGH